MAKEYLEPSEKCRALPLSIYENYCMKNNCLRMRDMVKDLNGILDDCVDRINRGEKLEDCLASSP